MCLIPTFDWFYLAINLEEILFLNLKWVLDEKKSVAVNLPRSYHDDTVTRIWDQNENGMRMVSLPIFSIEETESVRLSDGAFSACCNTFKLIQCANVNITEVYSVNKDFLLDVKWMD